MPDKPTSVSAVTLSEGSSGGSPPDQQLVRQAQRGDRKAFEELVRRHSRSAYSIALRITRRHADAEDLAQEALVRAFKGLDRFRGKASFSTWLYRITVNLSLNHLRRAGREVTVEDTETWASEQPQALNGLVKEEQMRLLQQAVAKLPPKQRAVVELRIQQELPFKEIAQIIGCSVSTAKVHFFHATQGLKKLMTEQMGETGC